MRKLVLSLIAILAACTIEQRGAPEPDSNTEVVVGHPDSGDSVEVLISMPTFASVGDEVPIAVVVRNNTNRRLDLHLSGRQTNFDIVIMRGDSTVVWERQQHAVQQILQLRPLQPGSSFMLEERWRAEVPGDFFVTAMLPTDGTPFRAPPAKLTVR